MCYRHTECKHFCNYSVVRSRCVCEDLKTFANVNVILPYHNVSTCFRLWTMTSRVRRARQETSSLLARGCAENRRAAKTPSSRTRWMSSSRRPTSYLSSVLIGWAFWNKSFHWLLIWMRRTLTCWAGLMRLRLRWRLLRCLPSTWITWRISRTSWRYVSISI